MFTVDGLIQGKSEEAGVSKDLDCISHVPPNHCELHYTKI